MKKSALFLAAALLLMPALLCAQHEQMVLGDSAVAVVTRANVDAQTRKHGWSKIFGIFHLHNSSHGASSGDSVHTENMVTVTARHADGTVFYVATMHNLKTTGGIDCIASQISNTSTQCAAGNYIALSSSLSSPSAGDCAAGSSTCTLTGEITTNGLARHQATYAHSSGTSTYTLSYTWTATGTVSTVTGVGVFNASSSGTMLFETLFSNGNASLVATDQLSVVWTNTIS